MNQGISDINRKDIMPVYHQLKQILISESKKIGPGGTLPSFRELRKHYQLSQSTIDKAFFELEKEGFIYRIQGKGTFVADPKVKAKNEEDPHKIETIGLIVADLAISFHTDIARAVEDEAHKRDFQIILGNSDNKAQKEEAYMRRFSRQQVEGMVVVTGKNSLKNKYFQRLDKKIPFVIVDTFIDGVRANYVTTDDLTGAYEATKHLIELGHKRIIHLTGQQNISTSRNRLAGYKKALIGARIIFDEKLIKETDFTEESGYQVMKELLTIKNKPTAVFAITDLVAAGAIQAIREVGLQVPTDISVVGYGGLSNGLNVDVLLTTVFQPAYEMGKKTAEILFEKIEGKRGFADIKEVILPTKLVVRASSGVRLSGAKP